VKQSIMQVKAVVALGNEQIARQRGLVAMLEMRGQKSREPGGPCKRLRRDSGNVLSSWNARGNAPKERDRDTKRFNATPGNLRKTSAANVPHSTSVASS
jgi:hypothetical protein